MNHPGNVRYRALIREHTPAYVGKAKFQKTQLSQEMLTTIKNRGGSFLKQQQNEEKLMHPIWVPVNDTVALRKIAHSFRSTAANMLLSKKSGKKTEEASSKKK